MKPVKKKPRSYIAQTVAEAWGMSADYVRKVMRGERYHPGIIKTCPLPEKKQATWEAEFRKGLKRG